MGNTLLSKDEYSLVVAEAFFSALLADGCMAEEIEFLFKPISWQHLLKSRREYFMQGLS